MLKNRQGRREMEIQWTWRHGRNMHSYVMTPNVRQRCVCFVDVPLYMDELVYIDVCKYDVCKIRCLWSLALKPSQLVR